MEEWDRAGRRLREVDASRFLRLLAIATGMIAVYDGDERTDSYPAVGAEGTHRMLRISSCDDSCDA